MCRSIKKLRNPDPATTAEMRAAALQFVRKISGCRVPPKVHAAAFEEAVEAIALASASLLECMGPPRTVVDKAAGDG